MICTSPFCRYAIGLAIALFIGSAPLQTLASGALETEDFADVVTVVAELVEQYGAENVLLVCDIDNTLLAMDTDFGSDQWFEWQSYLLEYDPKSKHLVADNFDGLLEVQGLLFSLGEMHPPQPEIPDNIAEMQKMGISTLVLTSRGDAFRTATELELEENGYDFVQTVLPITGAECGPYLPYDRDAVEQSGLTAEEAEQFDLPADPKEVSFEAGVFMTSGQHKGAMLLTLLARCDRDFKAVVFVDDHARHVVRVYDALARRGLDVTCFHYKLEDDNVKRFEYSDKSDVTRRWLRLD
ncbi:MAG: DUF2608 domain-containing protein, partial [Planctomycetota bacterium]